MHIVIKTRIQKNKKDWHKQDKRYETYKKKTMTRRRKKCVKLAKDIVKIRDKFTCQNCWVKVVGVNCQWSHVISEGRDKKLSCDPLNIKVLCYNCHKRWRHLEPWDSGERFKKKFPIRWKHLEKEHKETKWSIWKDYFIQEHKRLSSKLIMMCKKLKL